MCISATSNKREIADKQKMDETNNISERSTKLALPSLEKTGQASEDLNLLIDDHRKS